MAPSDGAAGFEGGGVKPYWWAKRYAKTQGVPWWIAEAEYLTNRGRQSESTKDWDTYDAATVRRSVVYTREDLVQVVALLGSANVQLDTAGRYLRWITVGIWTAVAALIYMCIRLS